MGSRGLGFQGAGGKAEIKETLEPLNPRTLGPLLSKKNGDPSL
jgi:hypothetical protein